MTQADIYKVFDKGGVLEKNFPSYEYREGQLHMAELAREAYEKDAILAVEAGTGIGKSFAYLVPALYTALENPDEKTVIATSTINLQKQLYEKDVPMLFSMLGKECKVALAVGRGHYLCLRRYMDKKNDSALLAQDEQSLWGRLQQWVSTTKSGLLSEFPYRFPDDLYGEINSDGDLCQGWNCPYRQDCFFMKSKQEQKDAKIIISNHHLLFSDAQSRYADLVGYDEDAVLPAFSRLVIDEAHNIEDNATSFFTATYDSRLIIRQLSQIEKRRGKAPMLEKLAPYGEADKVDRINDDAMLLKQQMTTLDQFMDTIFQKSDYQPCLITVENQKRLVDFVLLAEQVAATSGRLASKIDGFLETNKAPDEFAPLINELKVRGNRIRSTGEVLASFSEFSSWGDDIHWFNSETDREKRHHIQVMITPLSVSKMLDDAIFRKLKTVICTSATLELNDDFAYWGSRVGLPYDNERVFLKGVFPSPFDFKRNLLLLTPLDAPVYDKNEPQPYLEYISKTLTDTILSAGGGTLVLFTSYRMLKTVRKMVQPKLEEAHLTLYGQGDMDRFSLLNAFKSETDSSLFATSSFWEGVDAPGHTLRMVIIVKLPFQVPSDPVFKARCDALDAKGESAFMHLSVPETTMKLKQGFGRLLRTKDDHGVVVVLDSRIIRKGYGVAMLRSLPESYHPETMSEFLCGKIESFLYQ